MQAPLPHDEAFRLEALRRYQVLDTVVEREYDDLAFLASQICQTPIALVSFVDSERQWFKASVGLDLVQTSRESSFCAHAILQPDVFSVPDASLDARFSDNIFVTGESHLRFYAGAPLVTSDGLSLGALCVIDREPRVLNETQKSALQALSRQVVTQLELRRTLARQQEEIARREAVEAELHNTLRHAHCILWRATVSRDQAHGGGFSDRRLSWDVHVVDEAAAQIVLPLDVPPGRLYHEMNFLATHPDDSVARNRRAEAAVEENRDCYSQEYRCLNARGEMQWLFEEVTLHQVGEDAWNAVGFCRDITQSRQAQEALRESEERFRRLSEGTFEALVISENGRILDANEKTVEWFGYSGETLRHMSTQDLLAPSARAQVEMMRQLEQETLLETEARRRDGSTFPVEIHSRAIPYNGREARVMAIRDITQRREVERMKNEFIAIVSHELRTPLTSIRGSLGLLAGGVVADLPPRAQSMLEIAHNNSERLMRLINDILDIEKLASGKAPFALKPQLLLPIVESALESNRAYAQSFDVQLALQPPEAGNDDLQVLVDSDRLMQVLTNLLSNAAKFSPRGAAVQVRIAPSPQALGDAAAVRVEVSDQGPGVPAEFRDRIFGKFAQADSSDTRQKGGTGLGLSISKAIIEKLGGRIGFWSHPQQGTTFFFDLPRHQTEEAAHMST